MCLQEPQHSSCFNKFSALDIRKYLDSKFFSTPCQSVATLRVSLWGSVQHLRAILRERVCHYNHGRPHRSLGPGLPVPSSQHEGVSEAGRHWLPQGYRVMTGRHGGSLG
jgi:transposase InsO family protein